MPGLPLVISALTGVLKAAPPPPGDQDIKRQINVHISCQGDVFKKKQLPHWFRHQALKMSAGWICVCLPRVRFSIHMLVLICVCVCVCVCVCEKCWRTYYGVCVLEHHFWYKQAGKCTEKSSNIVLFFFNIKYIIIHNIMAIRGCHLIKSC